MKIRNICLMALMALTVYSCRKMSTPALGDYPVDANPPGGPLKFYVAFDGNTTDALMNAVDSVRANFASDNPLTSVTGISGRAIKGENKKFVKYVKPNDWATTAKSFTVSFWYRRDGQTKNNGGTNGPEYIMSFKSNNGHWSGSNLLLFLEGDNAACAVKVMIADKNNADNWFTWEGGNTIAGLLNNQWHHIVLTYNATNSTMTLYVDGVANPNTRTWGTHGDVNIDNNAITEVRVGAGPNSAATTTSDDWLASTWKGEIDQLRLYSSVLTQAEITGLFAGKK